MLNFRDYLESFFKRGKEVYPPKLQKKQLWWLACLVILGIILILSGNGKSTSKNTSSKDPKEKVMSSYGSVMAREEETMARQLEQMLSQVAGAGKVKVTVRLTSSTQQEYAVNTTSGRKTTEEKDQGGGNRLTTENTDQGQVVLIHNGQEEKPVVEKEQAARVEGVLVVAEGASEPYVKASLFQATRVALGAAPQKIIILPKERSADNSVHDNY
ncbi:MAG TPA: hypothetical protein DD719_00350 [Desulfotomaculum sp.]|nr:hypothetical protein [Desulfotomaculum sp.]